MPNVTNLLLSLQKPSSSSKYAGGAVNVSDSGRPELVDTHAASSVSGCSAMKPTRPDAYQPAITVKPTTMPAIQFHLSARNCLSTNAKITNAAPIIAATSAAEFPLSPTNVGKSCVVDKVTATASNVAARNTPKMPRNVNHANNAITKIVTSARKLPEPTRNSVLLPQPPANVMPKPKHSPPIMFESHINFGAT